MLPLQLLGLLIREPCQLSVGIFAVPLAVITLHPEPARNRRQKDERGRCKVEPAADGVVGRIRGQERPGRHQATNVAKEHGDGNGHALGRVGADVGAGLRVAQGTNDEGRAGHEERGGVSGGCLGLLGG